MKNEPESQRGRGMGTEAHFKCFVPNGFEEYGILFVVCVLCACVHLFRTSRKCLENNLTFDNYLKFILLTHSVFMLFVVFNFTFVCCACDISTSSRCPQCSS